MRREVKSPVVKWDTRVKRLSIFFSTKVNRKKNNTLILTVEGSSNVQPHFDLEAFNEKLLLKRFHP